MIDFFLPQSQQRGTSVSFGPVTDWFNSLLGFKTKAGVTVSEATALNYSAVACATRILCETAAQLPLKTYERLDNGGKREAPDEPLFDTFQYAPNPRMGAMPYREMSTVHMTNWGNMYSEIVEERGEIVLWPIHPSRIPAGPKVLDSGRMIYEVRNDNKPPTVLEQSEVLHIPGVLSDDGITGKGIVSLARESIGGAVATDRHGASFFGNGARPGGVLSHPTKLEKEARAHIRNEWKHVHGGPDKAGDIAVLYEGMTYTPISVPNNDAQFLETRTFNITEIARWYRVPPYMLADLTKATYSNVEFMGIEFVIYTMLPWLRRWEDGINRQLIPRARRREIFVEHNVAALLRGDIKSRYEAYKTGLIHGWLTINDILRLENMNPIGAEGDQRFFQRNMTTVERLIDGSDNAATAASTKAIKRMTAEQQQALRVLANAAGVPMGGEMIAMPDPRKGSSVAKIGRSLKKILAATDKHDAVVLKFQGTAKAGLLEAASRMVAKEVNAMRRAIGNTKTFSEKLEQFYADHADDCRDAMEVALSACDASGLTVNRLSVANWVESGRIALDGLLELDAEQFGLHAVALLDEWKSRRASDLVRLVLDTEKAA